MTYTAEEIAAAIRAGTAKTVIYLKSTVENIGGIGAILPLAGKTKWKIADFVAVSETTVEVLLVETTEAEANRAITMVEDSEIALYPIGTEVVNCAHLGFYGRTGIVVAHHPAGKKGWTSVEVAMVEVAPFSVGDRVRVKWAGKWVPATITARRFPYGLTATPEYVASVDHLLGSEWDFYHEGVRPAEGLVSEKAPASAATEAL